MVFPRLYHKYYEVLRYLFSRWCYSLPNYYAPCVKGDTSWWQINADALLFL